MPASEKRVYEQFEVSAGPASRWRRWTMFPLYFQAFKPRFRLHVKKISDAGRELDGLRFYIEFADKTIDRYFPRLLLPMLSYSARSLPVTP